jgi:antitoxin CptB
MNINNQEKTIVNNQKNHPLYWSCRRGMLELDLLLIPFLEDCYDSLKPDQQALFCQFLESADIDLFAWLTQPTQVPSDSPFADLITQIRTHAQTRPRT